MRKIYGGGKKEGQSGEEGGTTALEKPNEMSVQKGLYKEV